MSFCKLLNKERTFALKIEMKASCFMWKTTKQQIYFGLETMSCLTKLHNTQCLMA